MLQMYTIQSYENIAIEVVQCIVDICHRRSRGGSIPNHGKLSAHSAFTLLASSPPLLESPPTNYSFLHLLALLLSSTKRNRPPLSPNHMRSPTRCLTREAEATSNPPRPRPVHWHRHCDRGACSRLTDARPPDNHAVGIALLAFQPVSCTHFFLRFPGSSAASSRPNGLTGPDFRDNRELTL